MTTTTHTMLSIRESRMEDFDFIVSSLTSMHNEKAIQSAPLSDRVFDSANIKSIIKQHRRLDDEVLLSSETIIYIAHIDDTPIGICGMILANAPYFCELWLLHINHEHRRKGYAKEFLKMVFSLYTRNGPQNFHASVSINKDEALCLLQDYFGFYTIAQRANLFFLYKVNYNDTNAPELLQGIEAGGWTMLDNKNILAAIIMSAK